MEEEAFYSSAKHMIFLTKEQMFSIHMLTDTTQELHAYKTPLINLHIFLFFMPQIRQLSSFVEHRYITSPNATLMRCLFFCTGK